MRHKNNKPSTTLQEKREKLIALSIRAKELRQQKINESKTVEEAMFWQTRTINYMLLNHIYSDGGVKFETFKEWKSQGATIKKGAKATVIWGQPRQGVATLEQKLDNDPNSIPTEDTAVEEYEFFPLCFLFSEDDVYFTSANEERTQTETAREEPERATMIDDAMINEL